MIERKFVSEKYKEFAIQEFISSTLKNVGHSKTRLMRTPLGERIVIYASRPGLVVGRKGENIKKLTGVLKKRFGLENPQIEISQIDSPDLDAQIVAERIASTLERFGIKRFKAVGHKTLENVMRAGALGVEILISGKVPSTRARTWRFYKGYLKKSGEIAVTGVRKAYAIAPLKSGVIGVRVTILANDVQRPDDVKVVDAVNIAAGAESAGNTESKSSGKPEKSEASAKKDKEKKAKTPRKRASKSTKKKAPAKQEGVEASTEVSKTSDASGDSKSSSASEKSVEKGDAQEDKE